MGTMPTETSLARTLQIPGNPMEARTTTATTFTGGGRGGGCPKQQQHASRRLSDGLDGQPLPPVQSGPGHHFIGGVCWKGFVLHTNQNSDDDLAGKFVDMGELLREFWVPPWEDDLQAKAWCARSVQKVFTWLQSLGTYVSVLAPLHPEHVPE